MLSPGTASPSVSVVCVPDSPSDCEVAEVADVADVVDVVAVSYTHLTLPTKA